MFIAIYVIFSYIILFGGIFLTKFFTDKFECRKPYKTAVLVNVIWFLIVFFGIRFLSVLITDYLITIGADFDLIAYVNLINSVVVLIINLIVIALLINVFYKSGLKDSIFISLAIISIQVFLRIIIANVLSIIFSLTTGGVISFYVFQFF
jgi:hypothetical protein